MAECCYAVCHYAGCHFLMLSVVKLNVVMLSVVAPSKELIYSASMTSFYVALYLNYSWHFFKIPSAKALT